MYIDAETQFSDAQAVSAGGGVGTNVLDLGVDRSIGNGEPLCVMFNIDVAATVANGDEDYTFQLEYASDAAQTTARQLIGERVFESGTPTAPAQDADLLAAGFRFFIPIPPTTLAESERYLGIRYVTTGTDEAVTVTATLMPQSMVDATNDYADGFDIS